MRMLPRGSATVTPHVFLGVDVRAHLHEALDYRRVLILHRKVQRGPSLPSRPKVGNRQGVTAPTCAWVAARQRPRELFGRGGGRIEAEGCCARA